jgi:putative ABC transport system permease protein
VTIAGFRRFSPAGVMAIMTFSRDVAELIQAQSPELERSATYDSSEFTLTGGFEPQKVSGAGVSAEFFSVLGARPLLGRPILESDTKPANQRVAVVSYKLWKDAFGVDPALIGRKITLNRTPYTVVGVMPPEFDFGAGPKDLCVPDSENTGTMVARLKRGVTMAQTNAQLKVASAQLAAKYPKTFGGWEMTARQVAPNTGNVGDSLLILLGAVGFVLLIACANISSLQLARMLTGQREVAIREALGATRLRLVRQFLAESLLLALAGGALGLAFAAWGIRMLRAIAPPGTPRVDHLTLDPAVLGVTAAISIAAGVLFGLAPALQASARPVGVNRREGWGSSSGVFFTRRPSLRRADPVALVSMQGRVATCPHET